MGKVWTEGEQALLRKAYSVWPPDYSLLPDVPRQEIHNAASWLGFTKQALVEYPKQAPDRYAYLAGLLDSDGCVMARAPMLVLTGNDRRLHDLVGEWFPPSGTIDYKPAPFDGRTAKAPEKLIRHTRWTGKKQTGSMASELHRHLLVKRDRCAELLAHVGMTATAGPRLDDPYMAGMLDGDGGIAKYAYNNSRTLQIGTTDLGMVEWLTAYQPRANVYWQPQRNPNHKRCARVSWASKKNIMEIIERVRPWLVRLADAADAMP